MYAKIHAKLGCTVSKIFIPKNNILRNPIKKNLATLNDRSGQDSNCIFTIYLLHTSEEKLRHSTILLLFQSCRISFNTSSASIMLSLLEHHHISRSKITLPSFATLYNHPVFLK